MKSLFEENTLNESEHRLVGTSFRSAFAVKFGAVDSESPVLHPNVGILVRSSGNVMSVTIAVQGSIQEGSVADSVFALGVPKEYHVTEPLTVSAPETVESILTTFITGKITKQ